MATQGLVSVRENEKVVMKIVAGSEGYNAAKVAERLKKEWPVNATRAYDIAIAETFGHIYDLVVLTLGEAFFDEGECGELEPIYQATFSDPRFNPRWEQGYADFVEIVDL